MLLSELSPVYTLVSLILLALRLTIAIFLTAMAKVS